jgi:uncharacterized protein YjbI with pentapeptide repeats
MSQATPFIAKITLSSSAGPYADLGTECTEFTIYDTGDQFPDPRSGQTNANGTCVMRTAGSTGNAGLPGLILALAGAPLTLVAFGTGNAEAAIFGWAAVWNVPAYPFGMIRLDGWSIFQGSPSVLYIGHPAVNGNGPGPFVDVGMTANVVSPGILVLAQVSSSEGPASFYTACANAGLSSVTLDFDGVDLSGEDYSQAALQSHSGVSRKTLLSMPFGFTVQLSSTWANADLSHTTFAANAITNAAFDHAILNATNFRGATLIQVTFNGSTGTSPDFSGATLAGVAFAGTKIVTPLFNNQTVFHGSQGTADFSNASLPDTDFSHLDLAGIRFNDGNFTGAKFTGALLQGAVFDGAILTGADFSGAHLQGTRFTNTDVTQTLFGPNPRFSTDPLNRTSFAGSKLPANFNGNQWAYLDLSNASFTSRPATITDLDAQFARLCGLDFSNITFAATNPSTSPTNFKNAILAQTNFSNADLEGALFSSANAEAESDPASPFPRAAVFTAANLFDAQFDSAFLSGVDFSYALLWGSANLAQATLSDAVFANAYLASAQFTGLKDAQCGGLVFTGACLVNANFNGTTLQQGAKGGPVQFDGAFLQGATFTGATFSSVNLTGAVLATQGGSVTPSFTTTPPGTEPIPLPISYPPTLLQPSQTTSGTICVDGTSGACSAASLAPPNPMPSTWTQPAIGA